jgi:hypothetical protein
MVASDNLLETQKKKAHWREEEAYIRFIMKISSILFPELSPPAMWPHAPAVIMIFFLVMAAMPGRKFYFPLCV